MKRKTFLKISAAGVLSIALPGISCSNKTTHVLTLSFDDGFQKSFIRTAEIFEKYRLKACLNVMVLGHFSDFTPPDEYIIKNSLGDFKLWNELAARGHEIMPHGWNHTNLTQVSFEEATQLMDKSLNYFQQNLNGFKMNEAVFNFPFNASNPELEKYVLQKVRAVRTGGNSPINPFPSGKITRLSCFSRGPGNANDWLEYQVNNFLESTGGWLVLNLHGLDDEGWGPISSDYLDKLLGHISKLNYLEILPAGIALKKYG